MNSSHVVQPMVQFGLQFYKRWISPMFPGACRFVPSCSEYAAEAVEHHGALRGGALTLWRLLRCQPFARGGFDPVPRSHAPSPCCNQEIHSNCGAKLKSDGWQLRTGN